MPPRPQYGSLLYDSNPVNVATQYHRDAVVAVLTQFQQAQSCAGGAAGVAAAEHLNNRQGGGAGGGKAA